MEEEPAVIIVGAGPAGLATAACLSLLSITFVILEKEDCVAPSWQRRAYDRLHLHLAKWHCELPHLRHRRSTPVFMPKADFVRYLDDYAARFDISPELGTLVESASYNQRSKRWRVVTVQRLHRRVMTSKFLVVATGANAAGVIPDIPGLGEFSGEVIHSSEYRNGATYAGKKVLVVGTGNSGMEVAYDLANYHAATSIAVRGPFHVMTRVMICIGMALLHFLPVWIVDDLLLLLSAIKYGDLSKFGIARPKKGPFFLKAATGVSPVIDVGTVAKIKSGEIQLLQGLEMVGKDGVASSDGRWHSFDVLVFATGYRSTAGDWLLCDNGDGGAGDHKERWKVGEKSGAYFAGMSQMGIMGIRRDAQSIARHIASALKADENCVKNIYKA